jgi:hypothetical protein
MSLLLFVIFVLLLGQVSNKPRSELEEILQRIAPDKEVMIGISNYNLIPAGELVSFLDVRRALLPDFPALPCMHAVDLDCISCNRIC